MALTAVAGNAHPSMPAPLALELPRFSQETRLLVIAPHPDDETIATGLLIQRVRAAGGQVKILLLTAGDNNPWPQRWIERRLSIGPADRRRWGMCREAELGQALQRLDVPWQALQKLDWPDLGVTHVLLRESRAAIATLTTVIGEFGPGIVALPSIQDRHPDHGAAHVLARLALAEQVNAPLLLSYLIHGRAGCDSMAEVTGTAAQLQHKMDALTAHRSQMALSGRRMRRLGGRPERYSIVSPALQKTSGALPWQPPAWLQSRLQLSVAARSEVQTWRWAEAPLTRNEGGTYHLAPPVGNPDGPRFARLACDLPSPWIFDHWGWCEI